MLANSYDCNLLTNNFSILNQTEIKNMEELNKLPTQNPEIKEKIKETYLEITGEKYERPTQNPEITLKQSTL